jgi:glycosyltransferase involved in cell wall biosynthesis
MAKDLPFVSVVIPAYNEELMIPTCLESLKEQNYIGKYEIIVADNNSTDLTGKIANLYGATVIRVTRQGVACARQAGFLKAKGSIVLSTDADTIVPPNWISQMVTEITKKDDIVAIGGTCSLVGINTPLKLLSGTLVPFMFFIDKLLDYPGTTSGWNFAVKKAAFLKVGGFDNNLKESDIGEDRDLGKRLRKIGKVKVLFKIKVKTSARRFVGLFKSFKYVFINYFVILFNKKSLPGSFQPIRQRSYESYDVFNDKPFFLAVLLICLLLIMFLSGAVPYLSIWSTSSIKTQNKIIALTFDKSTSNSDTEQILQVLKSENVDATFFITGDEVKKDPAIVREIYSDGNIIGNHASTGSVLAMLKTPGALIKDINNTDNLIYKTIGVKPRFFRPIEGYRTIWGALSLDKYGYDIITWSVSANNSSGNVDSKQIAINVIKNAKPGAIIDLSDSGTHTSRATEEIIDLLTADGYKFVTLDKLLGKSAYFNN